MLSTSRWTGSLAGRGCDTGNVSPRRLMVEWSGAARSRSSSRSIDATSPSVWRSARRKTARSVSAVVIAKAEQRGWPLLPTRLPRCAQPGGGSPCSQVYFSGPSPVVEVLQNRVNPPIRLCGDPPACGHSLPAVARARADGHTCRTPLVRARWHLVAGIGLWRARSDRYRRAARFLTLGQSSCHSKRTKIAVITSRSSGTE